MARKKSKRHNKGIIIAVIISAVLFLALLGLIMYLLLFGTGEKRGNREDSDTSTETSQDNGEISDTTAETSDIVQNEYEITNDSFTLELAKGVVINSTGKAVNDVLDNAEKDEAFYNIDNTRTDEQIHIIKEPLMTDEIVVANKENGNTVYALFSGDYKIYQGSGTEEYEAGYVFGEGAVYALVKYDNVSTVDCAFDKPVLVGVSLDKSSLEDTIEADNAGCDIVSFDKNDSRVSEGWEAANREAVSAFCENIQGFWICVSEYGDYYIAVYEDGTIENGYLYSDILPNYSTNGVAEIENGNVLMFLHTDGAQSDNAGYDGFEAGDYCTVLSSDDDYQQTMYMNGIMLTKVDDSPENYKEMNNFDDYYEIYNERH